MKRRLLMAIFETPLYDRLPTLPKRAYQLARSGSCKDLVQIRRRLTMEGYADRQVEEYLAKQTISADLGYICEIADQQ